MHSGFRSTNKELLNIYYVPGAVYRRNSGDPPDKDLFSGSLQSSGDRQTINMYEKINCIVPGIYVCSYVNKIGSIIESHKWVVRMTSYHLS